MPRKAARAIDDDDEALYSPQPGLPPIPAIDNAPGAVAALLKANRLLRQRRWPAPYDRTRHLGIGP